MKLISRASVISTLRLSQTQLQCEPKFHIFNLSVPLRFNLPIPTK
jgi:hypothetical protein